jgi:hypothetical protein
MPVMFFLITILNYNGQQEDTQVKTLDSEEAQRIADNTFTPELPRVVGNGVKTKARLETHESML